MTEAANLAAQYPALRLIPLLALGLMLVEWLYARLALHDVMQGSPCMTSTATT